jgi:transcriptional regulator with XRE-family HTH domain
VSIINLKQAIINSPLPEKEIAFRVGKSVKTINAYKNGTRSPKPKTAAKLAEILKVKDYRKFYEDEL